MWLRHTEEFARSLRRGNGAVRRFDRGRDQLVEDDVLSAGGEDAVLIPVAVCRTENDQVYVRAFAHRLDVWQYLDADRHLELGSGLAL